VLYLPLLFGVMVLNR